MTTTHYIDVAPPSLGPPSVDRVRKSIRNAVFRVVAGIVIGFVALTVVAAFSGPVSAQQVTGDRTTLVKELTQRFAEHPVSIGLTSTGAMIEVFASEDGSTWTMLLTLPEGQSQVIGDGESWMSIPDMLSGTKISATSYEKEH